MTTALRACSPPKWVHSFTSSSQAPFLSTYEPSDLGWSGLGPAGIDFDSGVGFPEQICKAGSIVKKLTPSRDGSRGVISPLGHPEGWQHCEETYTLKRWVQKSHLTTGAPIFFLETPLGILTSQSQTLLNLHSPPDCNALPAL